MSVAILVVVDWQVDFLDKETGTLACPVSYDMISKEDVEKIHANVFSLIKAFGKKNFPIIFTRDWHPENAHYFSDKPDFRNTWPKHCIQGSEGAKFFHEEIILDELTKPETFIINKGNQEFHEEYSPTHRFIPILQHLGATYGSLNIYVCGVALEFCVKATFETLQIYEKKLHMKPPMSVKLICDACVPAFDTDYTRHLRDINKISTIELLGSIDSI